MHVVAQIKETKRKTKEPNRLWLSSMIVFVGFAPNIVVWKVFVPQHNNLGYLSNVEY